MKADMDDAPDYFRKRQKRKSIASVIPWLIGIIITVGSLHVLSTVVLKNTVQNLASQKIKLMRAQQPVAKIYRSEPEKVSSKDWDRIVEDQARRDATSQTHNRQAQEQKIQEEQERKANKAIEILNAKNFGEGVTEQQEAKTERKRPKEIVVVGKETRISSYCGGGEGSIARRNCKAAVELNSRN